MKQIDLIIFDLDGTLVNTLEDIAASVNYTLQKLGRPPLSRLIPSGSMWATGSRCS